MDKVLFTPAMIDTFSACERAYHLAFGAERRLGSSNSLVGICKPFLLRAITEINRQNITNVSQVQKFMGQHWPADQLKPDEAVKAFLFVYKSLIAYLNRSYPLDTSSSVGINLKVRSRIPQMRVYLEDSFDLILWHPGKAKLEVVDYHLHPLRSFDPSWPTASMLVKQFLIEKLRDKWPFKKAVLTFCQISPDGVQPKTLHLNESIYKIHWPDVLQTIEKMKTSNDYAPHYSDLCNRCRFLGPCNQMDVEVSRPALRMVS